RIVNTQDVMRAALIPGATVLVMALAWTAWRTRRGARIAMARLDARERTTACLAAAVIAALLGSVALGHLYAVEAAASGGVLLLAYAAGTGQLTRQVMRHVLADAMTLTGLLMALLVAATTFSLVLREFGADALIARGLETLAGQPRLLLACVLVGLVGCSFVLDAFEMVFLVIPLVMPPVLVAVADPAWVATLTLLVLQIGFLLPPFGYAVVMSRAMIASTAALPALARALAPYLLMQAALIATVLAWPETTHWTRPAEPIAAPSSAADRDRLVREAIEAQQKGAGDSAMPK
ncbi:MAG: TRAP transporter large permease subunit, partial [Pseudomonadota bacterium]|nr:TRAP transporter large permease subunit [Pseudomonadota bacterium]